jgi:hypothetical protein
VLIIKQHNLDCNGIKARPHEASGLGKMLLGFATQTIHVHEQIENIAPPNDYGLADVNILC